MQEQRNIKTHDFQQSIKVGKDGERLIERYLKNHPNIQTVDDVSNNPAYHELDIDYIIQFSNKTKSTIELKTDTYDTGNIFYETMSNVEYNVPGCMVKSKAEYLFYYFTKTQELYIIKFSEYKKWFEQNKSFFNRKLLKNINKKRTGTYTSEGYTIPKTYLEKNFKYFKKIILSEV